jgi:hypothetical protein
MNELTLSELCEKKRATKKAIEDLKAEKQRRLLDARRKIEDIKIDKELGLA